MKKILGELLFLIITAILGFIIFRIITTDVSRHQMEINSTLSGKVNKSQLMISSPVFGELTSIPVYEGEYVKKGQIVSKIKVISHPQDTTLLNTDVFSYNNDELTLKSPTDGVIASVLVAEKSTISPQTTFITIFPIDKTTVWISLPMSEAIQDYKNLTVSVKKDTIKYPILIRKAYPVKVDQNNQVYIASFKNNQDSKNFYDQQQVNIYAEKIEVKNQSAIQAGYSKSILFLRSIFNLQNK